MSADYTVRLEKLFQGPLDLLLHLVREQEVEIQDIEIAKILDGYLAYLDTLDQLDIEYAGDFLVMAATLMAIKSRSLLPHEELDLEQELDPRDELIQRLLEYRRFKAAAEDLEQGFQERARQSERGFRGELARVPAERELELGEVTVWDMLAIFSRLMRETLADRPHRVAGDPRPLRFYVDRVLGELRSLGRSSLRELVRHLEDVPAREALIGSFCALLELVRLQVVELAPTAGEDDIAIRIQPGHEIDAEDVVRASALDGEASEIPPPGPAPEEPFTAAPGADWDEDADEEPPGDASGGLASGAAPS